jgi:TRAP-type C4-dicarboxylate transport system permease small subunit
MNPFRSLLDRLLRGVISLLLAGMVLNVVWQVFTRFVLKSPSSFTEELARYSMIWLGLLGAAYCSGRKTHLALDLLTGNLEGRGKRLSDLFIQSCLILFALAVMVGGGGRLVLISLELGQTSAALQVKLGYIYLAVPISGALIAVYALMDLATVVRGQTVEARAKGDLT